MNQKRRLSDPIIEQIQTDIRGIKADNKVMKLDVNDIKVVLIGDIKDAKDDKPTFATRLRDVEGFVRRGRKVAWAVVVLIIGYCVKQLLP